MDERMSSGAFSARTRLSRKALRLYEEQGLLRPVEVDPVTGYRSYAGWQVERARLIGLLRRLGMPIARIAPVLDLDRDAAAKAVDQWWQVCMEDHAERHRLVHYVKDLLTGRDTTVFAVETRNIPEQKVLTTQRNVTVDALNAFIDEAFPRLFTHLGDSGVEVAGPPFVAYHGMVTEDSDGPVEICVPFTGRVEPAGALAVRLEPAHAEAYTRIPKRQVRYPDILRAYDAVSGWLRDRGMTVTLQPREVYFTDFAAAGDDDPVADIAFPYEPPADLAAPPSA